MLIPTLCFLCCLATCVVIGLAITGLLVIIWTVLFLILGCLSLFGIGGTATLMVAGLPFAGFGLCCLFVGFAPMAGGGIVLIIAVGGCVILIFIGNPVGFAITAGGVIILGFTIGVAGGVVTITITILGIPIAIMIAPVAGGVLITITVGGTVVATLTIGGALGAALAAFLVALPAMLIIAGIIGLVGGGVGLASVVGVPTAIAIFAGIAVVVAFLFLIPPTGLPF